MEHLDGVEGKLPMRLAGRNSVHLGGCQEIDAIVPSAVEHGRALLENSLVHF